MAESKELETLVYCLGQIGGKHNPVISSGSAFDSKFEYTVHGYARFIKEANNIIKYMNHIINYFLESVKPEFEEDPLAFIDSESEEDLKASIQKMKKQWKEMFKEHQKKLREALQNKTLEESPDILTPSIEESSKHADDLSEESSGSSAKLRRLDPEIEGSGSSYLKLRSLDPETLSEATIKAPETEPSSTSEGDSEVSSKTTSLGVPVERLEFPKSVFLERLKDFGRVLKGEYQELIAKVGKAFDRISPDHTAHDLKGFTLQRMEKFAKWKYAIKILNRLVPELESQFNELDLDFDKRKPNEKRLTDWMYFDDGKRDRKYHHRLLITMDLTVSIEEVSAIVCRQMRRFKKIKKSLESKLPEEYGAFNEMTGHWQYEVLYNRPMKKPVRVTRSAQSDDTYCGVEEMPEDA